MKTRNYILAIIILILVIFLGVRASHKNPAVSNTQTATTTATATVGQVPGSPVTVTPIEHATAILAWDGKIIVTDPVQPPATFADRPEANLILITDTHPDHFSTSTLSAIVASSTVLVPQAVKDMMSPMLANRVRVMKNGETITDQGFTITAVPMYNIPESKTAFHTKGRGNGYVIEHNGYRVYVAGDTSATPEMKALTNIDMAFIPMNLPYTMSVEEAAQGVLAFKPKNVYPYHYRGTNGLSDVNQFKQLVNAGDPSINVVLANWYQNQQ